jgi:hypothetical protein
LCFLERFDRSDQGFSWRFSFAQMIGSSFLTNVIVR